VIAEVTAKVNDNRNIKANFIIRSSDIWNPNRSPMDPDITKNIKKDEKKMDRSSLLILKIAPSGTNTIIRTTSCNRKKTATVMAKGVVI
jgi:hypothetical protein